MDGTYFEMIKRFNRKQLIEKIKIGFSVLLVLIAFTLTFYLLFWGY